MNNNNEIENIILQLKSLQLQQTELLVRLERARETETGTNRTSSGTNTARTNVISETREFTIGDRVRIKNPNRFQADRGTIVKIGASRITVQ
jgi:hypothetical protein